MLSLLAELDAKLRTAVEDYDFNAYTRLLSDFANNDLSAFYFDIRKDTLYCEVNAETGYQTDKRRAYRTVLDTLFHALVRYAAPVLVFTSEEVWGTRFPGADSVHLLEWPEVEVRADEAVVEKWKIVRDFRGEILSRLEFFRREKMIRSSLEAKISIEIALAVDGKAFQNVDFGEVCIVSTSSETFVGMRTIDETGPFPISQSNFTGELVSVPHKPWLAIGVTRTTNHKCGRCWRHLPEVTEDGDLCARCDEVVHAS